MPLIGNKRRIGSAQLLDLVDLEERRMLAEELDLEPPKKINDKEFSQKIIHLRRRFIIMLLLSSYIVRSYFPS